MPKLTAGQIRSIDAYLKKSGVDFLDIRYEMTDHVAAALEDKEGEFYDNFKEYMVLNKKELLKSNSKFVRMAGNNALRLIGRNLLRLRFLFLFCTVFLFSLLLLRTEMVVQDVEELLNIGYSCIIIGVFLIYFYQALIKKQKYSAITKVLGIACMFIYYSTIIFRVYDFIENETVLILYYSFFTAFTAEIFFTFLELNRKYKLRYSG